MPKRVFLARSPEGKVTTITMKVGEKAVPYGWEYFLCDTSIVPKDKKLENYWYELAKGKKIQTSTVSKISVEEIEAPAKAAGNHIQAILKHKKEVLQDLDVQWIRSQEYPSSQAKQKAITRFKQDLRNLTIDRKSFSSDEEVLGYWPDVFLYTIEDYMPLKKIKWPTCIFAIFIAVIIISPLLLLFL